MDRICREQEANGAQAPSFRTDDFILKITVPKVTENVTETSQKTNRDQAVELPDNSHGLTEKLSENEDKLTEKGQKLIEKLIEKAISNNDKLTENRISILRYIVDDPYISKSGLSKYVGISVAAISANIEYMRGKYLRRVGPDKGGFWEIIEE